MTWQRHTCEAICKVRARLWALHRGIGLGWAVHPRGGQIVRVRAALRPHFEIAVRAAPRPRKNFAIPQFSA